MIKGWDVGVATMTKGGEVPVNLYSWLCIWRERLPPKIGPNETLQFEVELFSWRGEDVTSDGGVVKMLLSKGENYSTPEDGTEVEGRQCLSV